MLADCQPSSSYLYLVATIALPHQSSLLVPLVRPLEDTRSCPKSPSPAYATTCSSSSSTQMKRRNVISSKRYTSPSCYLFLASCYLFLHSVVPKSNQVIGRVANRPEELRSPARQAFVRIHAILPFSPRSNDESSSGTIRLPSVPRPNVSIWCVLPSQLAS